MGTRFIVGQFQVSGGGPFYAACWNRVTNWGFTNYHPGGGFSNSTLTDTYYNYCVGTVTTALGAQRAGLWITPVVGGGYTFYNIHPVGMTVGGSPIVSTVANAVGGSAVVGTGTLQNGKLVPLYWSIPALTNLAQIRPTVLPVPAGFSISGVNDVSAGGNIVVGSVINPSGKEVAYSWELR